MHRRWLFLVLLLFLGGCAAKEVNVGGKPVRVPKRVVSLSPGTTEIVATYGLVNQLVGRTAACNYPNFILTFPPATMDVYAGVKPNYEKLATAKPDLIVYDRTLYSDADIAKLDELGLPKFELHATTVDDFIAQLKQLADALTSTSQMSGYIDKINGERALARSAAPATPPKVAVLTAGEGPSHLIAGSKSFVADVVRQSGGDPSGPDADRFVAASPEQLVASNPDVILLAVDFDEKNAAPATAAVKAFVADPRFKAIKAVKDLKVYPIMSDVVLREGARVDSLIQAIAKVVSL